jgi:hypothetical protein
VRRRVKGCEDVAGEEGEAECKVRAGEDGEGLDEDVGDGLVAGEVWVELVSAVFALAEDRRSDARKAVCRNASFR